MLLEAVKDFNLVDNLAEIIVMGVLLAMQSLIMYFKNIKPKNEIKYNLEQIVMDVNHQKQSIEEIKAELKTNGGSSLKDVVNKIHHRMHQIEDRVDNLHSEARARTELALDQSTTAQFLCNEKGEITFVNDAMSDMFGIGKAHFLRHKWLSIVDSQTSKEEIVRRMTFASERKISSTLEKIPAIDKKGRKFVIKIMLEPKFGNKDNFLWYSGKIREEQETTNTAT